MTSQRGGKVGKRGNGEGTIRQRANGRWEARLNLADGRRKSFYATTRQEAARRLAEATRDRDRGLPTVQDERQRLDAFLESWLERVKPTIRPRTWTRYRQLVAHVTPTLGKTALAKLTPQQVEHLYAAKLDAGLSPTTVHHLHSVLHHALEDALRKGLVPRNVTELVDAPKMRHHEMQPLGDEQVHQLLEAETGERLAALYTMAVTTGMRQGELLGLHWHDVDLDAATLHVRYTLQRTATGFVFAEPKTKRSRRRIALPGAAIEALRAHRMRQLEERMSLGPGWDDKDLVFANEAGRPIEAGNLLRRSFQPLLTRARLPRIRFHDLRHTCATLLLRKRVNPKIVSELLGHTSVAITLDIYSHVLPDMQQDATAAMDLVFAGR